MLQAKQILLFTRGYSLHISTTGITQERGAPQATGPAQVEWKAWIRTIPESAASLVWNAPRGIRTLPGSSSVRLWGPSTGADAAE